MTEYLVSKLSIPAQRAEAVGALETAQHLHNAIDALQNDRPEEVPVDLKIAKAELLVAMQKMWQDWEYGLLKREK